MTQTAFLRWLLLVVAFLLCVNVAVSLRVGVQATFAAENLQYKVVNLGQTGWESALNQYASQGWQLVQVEDYKAIFKK